jgi:hypothetical protein
MKIAYIYVTKDGPSAKKLMDAARGFGAERVLDDREEDGRFWTRPDLWAGHALRQGDELILVTAESLLDRPEDMDGVKKSYRRMKADFRALLKPLAALGVRVSVAGGKPVLYATDEDVDTFIDLAVAESHGNGARAGGQAKGKPGRPVKYFATDEQKKMICAMWWDKAIDRETVRRNATEMVGWSVTDNVVKSWCGVKREKPDG